MTPTPRNVKDYRAAISPEENLGNILVTHFFSSDYLRSHPHIYCIREGFQKKNPYFLWSCRIILGPPKHVLHLVWSAFVKYTANRTALKVALYDFLDGPPAPLNSQLMEKVNHYNLTKKINFSMGPSVLSGLYQILQWI